MPDAGAIYVESSLPEGVEMAAFVNPDSSLAIIAANHNKEQKDIVVKDSKREFTLTLPARSIASARWKSK